MIIKRIFCRQRSADLTAPAKPREKGLERQVRNIGESACSVSRDFRHLDRLSRWKAAQALLHQGV